MTFLKKLFLILVGRQTKSKLGKEGAYEHFTDEELVKEIVKSNSPMLFGELYDRYIKVVYNKCYSFSKTKSEAEDLTQDVFLMLYVKLGTFKGKSKFSTWMYSLTYNFCTNYVNRDKQRKMNDKSIPVEHSLQKISNDEVSDDEIFQMQSKKLSRALTLITPEDKSILLLKYQDETSIKELANLMELTESAVKMRLKRAKSRIVEVYNEMN